MLEHLFGSKTRLKLLMLFLQSPEEAFYVRELTRRIDTQINAVRREIQNLLRIGLIMEGIASVDSELKRPGLKRKYYTANNGFPLMPEVKALLLKAYALMEMHVDEQIMKLGDIKYLAFLGVFTGQKGQPVDVFIVGNVDRSKLTEIMQKLEKAMDSEINYSVMTPQEYAYRKEMADRFLDGILRSPKTIAVNNLEK
ncbi:MAG: hypothetical protein WC641_02900 [Patescibacteria group bacterium]